MNDKRKEYLKKWREDNKEHIKNYKKEYAKTHDSSFKKLQNKYKQLQQENNILQNNWNELNEYCLNEQIPEEYDEYNSYIEFSNSVYDNVLNKMQELEQGSGSQ